MPMSADDLADMKPKLESAKKNPVGFAVCLGNSPQTTVILFSKLKEPKALAVQAKKAGETTKITYGTVTVAEGIATLHCVDDVPAGLCKKVKGLFASQKLTLKVKALDPSGQAADVDESDVAGAAPGADGPGAPQTTAAEPTASAATDTDTGPAPQRNEAWDKIVAAIGPRVADYVQSGGEKAPQVAAAWKGAQAVAKAGRFDDAMLVVNKIMPLLRDVTRPETAPPSAEAVAPEAHPKPEAPVQPEAPAAPDVKPTTPRSAAKPEDFVKAARLWRETFKSMRAEMGKLEAAIVRQLSPDPRMAGIAASASDLSDYFSVFDLDLAEALDTAPSVDPDALDALRAQANNHLRRYAEAIETPFFRDVDDANGFAKVAVAAIARRSLGALGKLLA